MTPNKLLLTTPGINVATEEYDDFGVPATILANYLRENGIVPEKCDLNSILFLLTPAETIPKIQNLVSHLVRFEEMVQRDAPLEHVLPSICSEHRERYAGYTVRRLAQEMHDFYKQHDIKQLQKVMFREEHFPAVACAPNLANDEFTRGNVELVAIRNIVGRIAGEGALPFRPASCASSPARSGGSSSVTISSRLRKVSTSSPGSPLSCRACTCLTNPTGRYVPTATSCRRQ